MASPGDKVGTDLRLDPGILELFSNLDDPVDLQPLPGSRGDVWDYQPSHPNPIPISKPGRHLVGVEGWRGFGWLLGDSPPALPFPNSLWCRAAGIPMESGRAGPRGVDSAPHQLLPFWNCYLKP